MVQVLSFQMHRFVNLTTEAKDTLPLRDYLFDQTYGLSDGSSVLLCFEKQKLENKKELEINIAECGFGAGNMKFTFKNSDIQKMPAMQYLPATQ
jgi:hypothetical protein